MKRSFLMSAFALGAGLGCQSGASAPTAASPKPTPSGPTQEASSGAFASPAALETALAEAVATGKTDGVWARIIATGHMPLVFGKTAMFFYRGPGEQVEWRGEFTSWHPTWDAAGERVGTTDIWRKTVQLLPGSRLDYKIVVDGQWQLDPHNPYQQVGGFGPNSEARMPEWTSSPYIVRTANTPQGKLTDNLTFKSRHLGYDVHYRVYTPPDLSPTAKNLPTLFVTDGSDYYRDEMGAMVIVLDRLYEERKIAPIVVVFVDHWDQGRTKNRRTQELIPQGPDQCLFCDFLVEELIPEVGRQFPTTNQAARRGILGTSYGGLHATYMGLAYPESFGLIGMQSPAYHPYRVRHVLDRLLKATTFPPKAFLNVGRYERRYTYDSSRAAQHLAKIGTDLRYVEAPEGHSWGHWRSYLDEILIHFFGAS